MSSMQEPSRGSTSRGVPDIVGSHIALASESLETMCTSITTTIRARRGIFAADSAAIRERIQCPYVGEVYESIQIRLINVIDHGVALNRLIADCSSHITPWTVARAVLENCATMWWLTSPETGDWKIRATRAVRLDFYDIHNFLKFRAETIDAFPERDFDEDTLRSAESKRNSLENLARELDVWDHAQKRMPNQTELVNDFIDQRSFNYRLLSSFAHGRESLIGELLLDGRVTRLWRLQLLPDNYHVWSLINATIYWVAKATWSYFRLTGWNYEDVYSVVRDYYDRIGVAEESRFVPHA